MTDGSRHNLKIMTVFTGGTIGSQKQDGIVRLSDGSAQSLIGEREPFAEFDSIEPYCVLSENITPEHWIRLYDVINGINADEYDGIIITHGSDTLCYTAAALHNLLHDCPLPVVLVAANKPVGEKGSNAEINFSAAVSFIEKCSDPGVYAAWSNNGTDCDIYYGDDIMQSRVFENRFCCAFSKKAEYSGEIVLLDSSRRSDRLKNAEPRFCTDILRIVPYPGIDYSLFYPCLSSVRAVLHETYHSSTVGEGFRQLALHCLKKNIPVFVASCDSNAGVYETESIYAECSANVLCDITPENALIRLMLCFGNNGDNAAAVKAMLGRD